MTSVYWTEKFEEMYQKFKKYAEGEGLSESSAARSLIIRQLRWVDFDRLRRMGMLKRKKKGSSV